MFTQGIPLAAFEVSDIQGEYARLVKHGVAFTREPTRTGPVTIAIYVGHEREADPVVSAGLRSSPAV
jgi:Glyoxalase/Bleomycin resistance protein/Dioxygenase superfamily